MFKRSKSWLFGLIFTMLFTILLSACGGANNAGNETVKKGDSKQATDNKKTAVEDYKGQTITVAAFGSGKNESFEKWMNAIAEKIGIKVDIQYLGDGEQNVQLYKTKVATKSLPDLSFYHAGASFKNDLIPQDNMVDLSNEPWIKDVEKTTLDSLGVEGKVYAAPSGGGLIVGGVFYNKQIFKDLNLSIPTTLDQLMAAAKKIKEAGKVPLYISGNEAWTLQIAGNAAFAYDYLANNGILNQIYSNKASFNDLKNYKGIYQLVAELKNQKLINEDYLSATYRNAQDQLIQGKAAMYIMGDWLSIALADSYTAEQVNNIGFFPLPSKDGKLALPLTVTGSIAVANYSKHKEAALAFIRFYMSEEGQQIWLKNTSGVARPANKNVKVDTSNLNELVKDIYKVGGEYPVTPLIGADSPVNLPDFGQIVQDMLVGNKSAEDLATAVSDQFKKNAKAGKIPGF